MKNTVKANYFVGYRIAKCIKNHKISENFIFPYLKDLVHYILGEEEQKKMNKIPLLNNPIPQRIQISLMKLSRQL